MRRRYAYRPNPETGEIESVEVGGDWTGAERRAQTPTEGITYDGLRATDGTDLSSRTKHAAFMKSHNVALVSDFKETWAAQEKQREAFRNGESRSTAERRERLGRALYARGLK